MPLQWRNQFWQSLEEGAGNRRSECVDSVSIASAQPLAMEEGKGGLWGRGWGVEDWEGGDSGGVGRGVKEREGRARYIHTRGLANKLIKSRWGGAWKTEFDVEASSLPSASTGSRRRL